MIYPKIAEIYFTKGEYAKALEFYRKSLELVPRRQMADIQFKVAEVLQAQGDAKQAAEEYMKVLYLYSGNKALEVKALLRVAKISEDNDDLAGARSAYEKVIAMNVPESKFARDRLTAIK